MTGHTQIVEMLLKNGANAKIKNNQGKTALDLAKNNEIKAHICSGNPICVTATEIFPVQYLKPQNQVPNVPIAQAELVATTVPTPNV